MKKLTGLVIALVISSSFLWAQDRAKIETWTVEADTLMNRQDYEGALKLLNKIISESKLSTDDDYLALYNRALSYFSLGRYDEALKDINQYIAKFPEQHALMLRLYINNEKGVDAADQLDDINKLVEANPGNPDLLSWRIGALMSAEKYAEARRDIRALRAMDDAPQLTLSLATSYYYEEKPDSALLYFEEYIKQDPLTPEGYVYAGSLCIEHEEYELALQYLNEGLKKLPSDGVLIFYKGVALVELERTEEGCRCLTKAFNNGFDDASDYLKEYCYGLD